MIFEMALALSGINFPIVSRIGPEASPSFFGRKNGPGGQIAVCQQFGSCFDQFRVEIQRKIENVLLFALFPKPGMEDTADLGRRQLKGNWLLIPVGRRKIIHPKNHWPFRRRSG